MMRAFVVAFLLGLGLLLASPGCADIGVGDPCTPEQEFFPDFLGFDEKQVIVESKSFQCRTRICLVNHFRGRASCPYGQNIDGSKPTGGEKGCTIPGTNNEAVTGLTDPNNKESYGDPRKRSLVAAQCKDRPTDRAVYCSCRCADINGEKPSDQAFCECPDGFACKQLVTSIGQGNEGLTGGYCIKDGTDYNPDIACNSGPCEAALKNCGNP